MSEFLHSYFIPLKDYFADTVQNTVAKSNLRIGRGHCFELISSFFGFNTYAALTASGLLSRDKYLYSPEIDLNKLASRANHLNISPSVLQIVEDCLLSLHDDELDHFVSLVKRLARNVKHNTSLDKGPNGPIFSGSVFLDEIDWENCGNIASSDEFEDYQFTDMLGPTIQFLVLIHNNPVDGFYPINPDPILNIIAFLSPSLVRELLAEMQVQ